MSAWKPILGACLLLLGAVSAPADLLILAEGEETQGELISLDSTSLHFRSEAGEEKTIPRSEVSRLELYRDLSGTSADKLSELKDPLVEEVLQYVADAKTYPSAGAVNLYLGYRSLFEADWSQEATVRNIVRVLQERGKGEGTVTGSWLKGVDRFHFDFGRTYLPDGSIRGLTDKGVRVAPVNPAFPEYDRKMRQLQTLPAVDVGRVVDWQYSSSRKNSDPYLQPFYQHVIHLGEPVMRGLLELRLHQSLDLDLVLTRTEGVTHRRRMEGDYRIETFEWLGAEPGKRENSKPPGSEIYPTVYLAPRKTWKQISESLRPAVEQATEPGPLTAALLREILADPKGPEQTYLTLAQWVAREVRLVGIMMADFRYAPRNLEEVLSTRTGNYLDKTMALHGLLQAAGVESELYLSRDRYLSPMPDGVRALGLFNDALVRVKLPGGWVFRTPDDKNLDPYVLPSAFYDTQALRISGKTSAEELTPVEAPPLEQDVIRVRYLTELGKDGSLTGSRDLTVRGNSARTVRSYRNLSGDQLRKRMEKLNHGFHPNARLLGYEFENLADFSKDVTYIRRFQVPGYALRAGGKLLAFRLPGLVASSADVGSAARIQPLAFMTRDFEEVEIEIKLPPGFRVLHLPEGLKLDGNGYAFRSDLKAKDGKVLFQSRFTRTCYRISPEDYPAYKRMREERARLARQWVVIEMVD
jgi:hypothetical protein